MDNIYLARLAKLQSFLSERDLEVAMITSPTNIYYFTGFFSDPHERFMALIADARKGQAYLFVPSLDMEAAQNSSALSDIIPVADTDQPYDLLRNRVGHSVRAMGVEKKSMSLYQAERLQQFYPQVQLADVEEFIFSLRLKKTREDIQIVRRAIDIAERVMHHGVSKVKPGITELELTAELEYQMKVLGADRPSFSTLVLSGPASAMPHGHPGQRKIQEGEFLLFDLGVFVDGYCSDITRTFVVGKASEEQRMIYGTVKTANERAIEAIKPGEPIGSVDMAARSYIEAQGYGSYFIHRVGHGLGLEIHESPSIHAQNTSLIEPGLLFTVEPGVYIPDIGGVRIEDDIYVNEHGEVEVLTTFPKQLTEL